MTTVSCERKAAEDTLFSGSGATTSRYKIDVCKPFSSPPQVLSKAARQEYLYF